LLYVVVSLVFVGKISGSIGLVLNAIPINLSHTHLIIRG
jgi:hypothetical protein